MLTLVLLLLEQSPPPPQPAAPPGELFHEDFDAGLAGWVETVTGATVNPNECASPPCIRLNRCMGGGQLFSVRTVECSLERPCIIELSYKGPVWVGFASCISTLAVEPDGSPGGLATWAYQCPMSWAATQEGDHNWADAELQLTNAADWTTVSFAFPTVSAVHTGGPQPRNVTIGTVHLVLEALAINASAPWNLGTNPDMTDPACHDAWVETIVVRQAPPPPPSAPWACAMPLGTGVPGTGSCLQACFELVPPDECPATIPPVGCDPSLEPTAVCECYSGSLPLGSMCEWEYHGMDVGSGIAESLHPGCLRRQL